MNNKYRSGYYINYSKDRKENYSFMWADIEHLNSATLEKILKDAEEIFKDSTVDSITICPPDLRLKETDSKELGEFTISRKDLENNAHAAKEKFYQEQNYYINYCCHSLKHILSTLDFIISDKGYSDGGRELELANIYQVLNEFPLKWKRAQIDHKIDKTLPEHNLSDGKWHEKIHTSCFKCNDYKTNFETGEFACVYEQPMCKFKSFFQSNDNFSDGRIKELTETLLKNSVETELIGEEWSVQNKEILEKIEKID